MGVSQTRHEAHGTKGLFPVHVLFQTGYFFPFPVLHHCHTSYEVAVDRTLIYQKKCGGKSAVLPPGTLPAEYDQIHLC